MDSERQYTSRVLGDWWRAAALVPGILVIGARLTDSRKLALVALALCVALLTHAAPSIAASAET